jgi:hypothetical protein
LTLLCLKHPPDERGSQHCCLWWYRPCNCSNQ